MIQEICIFEKVCGLIFLHFKKKLNIHIKFLNYSWWILCYFLEWILHRTMLWLKRPAVLLHYSIMICSTKTIIVSHWLGAWWHILFCFYYCFKTKWTKGNQTFPNSSRIFKVVTIQAKGNQISQRVVENLKVLHSNHFILLMKTLKS